ncbi:MAG: macro domain-containing protein [Thermoproteota archaeon]|jgi:Predicted phosphatase homologous to the C-terminal domain of histone macroH2A1
MELIKTVYKDVIIGIKKGDLTEEDSEAIVNPANSLMIMGGGVAYAIKKKGGEEIEKEAIKKAPVEIGKAVVTKAGKLKTKYVIHSPTMERPAMNTTKEKVYKSTFAAIKAAYENDIKVLSFPAMGTGVGGLSFEEASESMIKAIKDAIDEGYKLKNINIVLLEDRAINAFIEALKIYLK